MIIFHVYQYIKKYSIPYRFYLISFKVLMSAWCQIKCFQAACSTNTRCFWSGVKCCMADGHWKANWRPVVTICDHSRLWSVFVRRIATRSNYGAGGLNVTQLAGILWQHVFSTFVWLNLSPNSHIIVKINLLYSAGNSWHQNHDFFTYRE